MGVALNCFRSQTRAVQKQLHAIEIGETPDVDFLTLSAAPVPVRKQMQYGFRSPPRLVIVENVFGEAAGVQRAEVRTDTGPAVRRRLATIIKSGPGKGAGEKGAFSENLPPSFGRHGIAGMVNVVGADVALL